MIKHLFLLLLLLFPLLPVVSQTRPPQASDTPLRIPVAYIADPTRPTLLVFISDNCYPCHRLINRLFRRKKVNDILQQVNLLYVNVGTPEGLRYYQAFCNKHRVGLPYLALFDSHQNPINRFEGCPGAASTLVGYLRISLRLPPYNQ